MSFKKHCFIAVIVLALITSRNTTAQQTVSLSLQEAIQIGLEKNKSNHSALMKVQYADARASEANASLLPSLKLNGSYTRLSDVPPGQIFIPANLFGPGFPPNTISSVLSPTIIDNYNVRLSLQQPLFTGFRFQKSADIAEYTAQATQEEYKKNRSELLLNIKDAYWNLVKTFMLQNVVDENVAQMKAHLKDVQSWQGQGMITNNDVLKVQVQLSETQLRQIDARNNVRLAMINLNSLIGLPLDTEIHPTTEIKFEPREFGDLNSLNHQAVERRPELKSMEYNVKAADAGISLARSGWFPQIYLSGNYYYNRPNQRFFPTQDAFKDTWDLSLSVSVDVWNWGATIHQTDQAKALLSQAQDGLSQLRDAVTLGVTRSYLNLARAKERIAVAEQGVKQAEESYRVTQARFKQGLALNSDLLDAEVALLQAKTNYTQALVDYKLAEANLELSIGE